MLGIIASAESVLTQCDCGFQGVPARALCKTDDLLDSARSTELTGCSGFIEIPKILEVDTDTAPPPRVRPKHAIILAPGFQRSRSV